MLYINEGAIRNKTKKNTTQYVLDATMYTPTNTNEVNKTTGVQDHRFYVKIVMEIRTRNSKRKDT